MSVWLSDLSHIDVAEVLTQTPIVLIPVGAIEQHGPHLPVDVDIRIASRMCESAALAVKRDVRVVIAPPLPFGISEHHMRFPGTVSFSSDTFMAALFDIGRSLTRHGFDRLVIVNGHGGNVGALQLVANRLQEAGALYVVYLSEWQLLGDKFVELRESGKGGAAHACELETSLYLHLRSEFVRMERAVREVVAAPVKGAPIDMFDESAFDLAIDPGYSKSGIYGDPVVATAEKGHALFERATERLAGIIRSLAAAEASAKRRE